MAFKKLNLIEPILKALASENYVVPTPIQDKTIPILLEGKDVMGIAQTGTGKTAAFVLPILQKITLEKKVPRIGHPRALVLTPTRELAAQIDESFSTYGKFINFKQLVIFGGVSQVPQVRTLHRSVDVLIATPGRLLDLMNQRHVFLEDVEFFVLDEADRMLDMGFINDVRKIAARLPVKRQSLFFSATMSKPVSELAKAFLKNPVRVEVTPESSTVEVIDQSIYYVDQEKKDELLLDLMKQENLTRVLVFTSMKHRADKIARVLSMSGIKADAIHGNKSQNQRTASLERFKSGKSKVLVATDIAARGIDIENISHVINYDLPNEPETYVHRIGRTARAGAKGIAYSFCASEERNYLRDIQRLIRKEIKHVEHPFHSERAKNATGRDAMPKPREQRGRGGWHGGGNHNRERRGYGDRDRGRESPGRSRFGEHRSGGGFRSRDRDDRVSRDERSERGSSSGGSRRPSFGGSSGKFRRRFR